MSEENLVQDNEPVVTDEIPANPSGDAPAEAPVDDWAPDYKYKVLDQEYEIDEFLRPAVTKDTYKNIIDVMTKAKGFEHYKSKNERLAQENSTLKTTEEEFNRQNKLLGYMGTLMKEKEYETLFKELNIPDEALTTIALKKLQYQELPPEQRQEYDRNLLNNQRLRNLEMQNQEYQEKLVQQTVQQRHNELNSLLSGQMKEINDAFDAQAGRPGAFKEAVVRQGQLAYYTQKKDLSATEAAEEVLRLYGKPQASQVPSTTESVAPSAKPIIPNIRGGNQSVVKTQVKSIDDLNKILSQMERN
jgi:hypothetical protein